MDKRMSQFTSAREPTCISQMGIKKLVCIFKPIIPLLPNSLHSRLVKLWPGMTGVEKRGPRTTCLRSQSRPQSTLKRYEFDRNGPNNASTLRALWNSLAYLKWVSKNYFIFLNPQFHFFQVAFVRGWSKLGLEWREVEKKGAQELHIFARNRDHVHNSQTDIQILFHLWKWRIYFFKNHFHSGLTRIIPKTIRIWSKWAKDCLNITSAREPTCISQMGIKKIIFYF